MTELYDQRIGAMKARERDIDFIWSVGPPLISGTLDERIDWVWRSRLGAQKARNIERRIAYKRKRISVVIIDDCAIFIDGVLRLYGDDVIPEKRH